MAEIQDVHMFKRKSSRVPMFRMMLETYRELFELRLHGLLQMFNAAIEVRKVIMLGIVLSQEFKIQRFNQQTLILMKGQAMILHFLARHKHHPPIVSLFAKDIQEQKYLKQPKIINKTIGDDQIDRNIMFDEQNEDVNSVSVEYDNNVQESYALEQLARNAYKEAEKQQIIAKKSSTKHSVD
nr:hypothetical protein [Tanacetum cinerariifolium]GEX28993.1 hypothetical protein [Tanacetum cinerariifolium]